MLTIHDLFHSTTVLRTVVFQCYGVSVSTATADAHYLMAIQSLHQSGYRLVLQIACTQHTHTHPHPHTHTHTHTHKSNGEVAAINLGLEASGFFTLSKATVAAPPPCVQSPALCDSSTVFSSRCHGNYVLIRQRIYQYRCIV